MTDQTYISRITAYQARLAMKILFSKKRSDTYAKLNALTLAKLVDETK